MLLKRASHCERDSLKPLNQTTPTLTVVGNGKWEGVTNMANDGSRLGTLVMNVILHFYLATILDYFYFLFRLLQPNY
jgi:hypothetical protein